MTRNGGLDADARGGKSQGQVVGQRSDLAHAHARLPGARLDEERFHAEHGDRGTAADLDHLAGCAEGGERLFDQAGALLDEFLVDLGGLGRFQHIGNPRQRPGDGGMEREVGPDRNPGRQGWSRLLQRGAQQGGEIVERFLRGPARGRGGGFLLQALLQPGANLCPDGSGPFEHVLQREVEGQCHGDQQPGDHHDDRAGLADGADQSLLEQGADVAAAVPETGALDGGGGRTVDAVEGDQQPDEEQDHAGEALDVQGGEAVHVARHQPDAQDEQTDRQEVVAPAEYLRQDVDPAAGEAAPGGREETEQRHQPDDGEHHAEDVHAALGRDVVEQGETFGRDVGFGGFTRLVRADGDD